MSRRGALSKLADTCFPRVSGDEPPNRQTERKDRKFSPRERG